MSSHLRWCIAALVLLSAHGFAIAGEHDFLPSDLLSVTGAEERLMWEAVGNTSYTRAPSGFVAMLDAAVPASLTLRPVPPSVVQQVPELKGYEYAMVENELLIVNPIDMKIVDIITQ